MTDAIKALAIKIGRDHANWLDDILAGLLINGVSRSEIGIEHHPGSRTVVRVRGVAKYEWTMPGSKIIPHP